jgi:hypothetical protein
MTGDSELWAAVTRQAGAWRDVAIVQRFAAQLPRNARRPGGGLPGLLQSVQAFGAEVTSKPLRLSSMLPGWFDMPGIDLSSVRPEVLRTWLDDAARVEHAHRRTVAWVRSRLPGYPLLPAPQLAEGSPLTTREFTWRLAWAPGERTEGLQLRDVPDELTSVLKPDARQGLALKDGARRLAVALTGTQEWARLREADAALDDATRGELRACRAAIAAGCSAQAVDAHEPDLAHPRNEYRIQAMAEQLATLTGAAAQYAGAFDAADRLIELAASDVFGQLTVHDTERLTGVHGVETSGPPDHTVVFSCGDVLLDCGRVVWLDDPLVPDAVQLTRVSFYFQDTGEAIMRCGGGLLTGTSTAWDASA